MFVKADIRTIGVTLFPKIGAQQPSRVWSSCIIPRDSTAHGMSHMTRYNIPWSKVRYRTSSEYGVGESYLRKTYRIHI